MSGSSWDGLGCGWFLDVRALRRSSCACAVVVGVALFVQLYEEPTLLKKFGAQYEEYRRNVPRWIPRLSAWQKYGLQVLEGACEMHSR